MKTLGERYPCPYCGSTKLNTRSKTIIGRDKWGFGYEKTQWYCKECQTAGPFLEYDSTNGWKRISNRQSEQCDLFKTAQEK